MEIKVNSTQWIKLAYDDWLFWLRNEKKQTSLRESTKNIIKRMKEASGDVQRREEAWNILERLKRLANSFDNMGDDSGGEKFKDEPAEIYLECALAAYEMDDMREALSLFQNPKGSFRRTLHKAITYWLLGCIQWQSQSHLEEALVSWERSLQIVREVEFSQSSDLEMVKKCKEIRSRMEDAILYASEHNCPPPVSSKKGASKTTVKARSAKLMTYPIYGRIPAGPPAWVPDETDEYAEVASVTLNDKEYNFFSLRIPEEFTINVHGGRTYFLLEVDGDSMNSAKPVPIESGNYVLMAKQDAAEGGDIVAVEIIREDRAATLKRYRFKEGKHWLEPESTNTELPSHISMTKDFHIRGIALAVLKPVE